MAEITSEMSSISDFLQGLDIHVPSFVRSSGLSFCHTLAPTNVWHWAPAEVTKPPYKSSLDELASVEVTAPVNKDPAFFIMYRYVEN